jgi:hypothetical protein
VLGDFNDALTNDPLAPLVHTDLQPAASHPAFDDGGRPGTFGNCTASQDFDHILLSPALDHAITAGEIFRMGAWGGKNGTLWPHYPTMTKAVEAASEPQRGPRRYRHCLILGLTRADAARTVRTAKVQGR